MQPVPGYFLLICIAFASCGAQEQKPPADSVKSYIPVSVQATKPEISKDTLVVEKRSAVLFQPDSLQIEKRMKAAGEENFRAGADDYLYYLNESAEFLKKKGITVVEARDRKFIKFVSPDKDVRLVRLDTLKELWGIYFFEPNKKPYQADMVMIEDEYASYFK